MPGPGVLRFEDIGFRYPGAERPVLEEVSFEVPPGAVLALVGDNGAGKTTLVKLLARFYEPSEGRITLDGQDVSAIDVAEWRATLTACFQDFCRFELRARETVGVGDLGGVDDAPRVARAVTAAGADDIVAGLREGLETGLGASWGDGADLSTGQWQKLALGRAMMRPAPRLLLLDEPTAALDAASEARLFERYAAASEFARATGSISVIVSHRMSTVRMADLIAVVEGGRVRDVGTHAELVARDGPYRELYSTQAAAYR
jgi:ATP-binding cassette subfamily B protein